jgi:hypothetical protein
MNGNMKMQLLLNRISETTAKWIFLFFLLTALPLYAQTTVGVTKKNQTLSERGQITLNWKSPALITPVEGVSLVLFDFDGAVFPSDYAGLPFWTGKFHFDRTPASVSIELVNPQFEYLSASEVEIFNKSEKTQPMAGCRR